MQVQTYETNETTSDGATDALDAEAAALIERLDLRGQQTLISTKGGTSLMPYQEMTAEEQGVFELLFPIKTKLHEYGAGPIPLRVLQVAALATERGWFRRLEVWHKRTGSAKEDPLLVGVLGHPNYPDMARAYFLMARWGDALRPYADMVREAAVTARQILHAAATRARAEIDAAAAQIDTLADGSAIRWAVTRGPTAHNETPPRD